MYTLENYIHYKKVLVQPVLFPKVLGIYPLLFSNLYIAPSSGHNVVSARVKQYLNFAMIAEFLDKKSGYSVFYTNNHDILIL